jgi:hypothetical protein
VVVEKRGGGAAARVATERSPSARANEEPRTTEIAPPHPTPSGAAAPERRIPAGGPTAPPRPAVPYLGAWLVERGAPPRSKEVVDHQRTYCDRVLQVGLPAEEAIQCEVVIDSSGRLELDGHVCEMPECVYASMIRTRVFVRRESKLRAVLDVPSSVLFNFDGGTGEYITAFVTVAKDGLVADVTLDGTCDEAGEALREDKKESSIRSTLLRFMAGAVDQVCAAQGQYTWSGGKFRR